MKQLLCIFLFFAMCACSSKTQDDASDNLDTAGQSSGEEKPIASDFKFPIEKDFYKHYKGKIGEVAIHMNLIKTGNDLRATYYYDKYGRPILLRDGKVDISGKFYFKEYAPNYDKTGSMKGTFLEKKISGTWFNADSTQQLPLELEESMDAYSLPMDIFYDEKVALLQEGNLKSPKHTFVFSALFPSSKYGGSAKDEIYNTFESFFGKDAVAGNPFQTLEKMEAKAVKNYREANTPIYTQDTSMAYAMNWSEVSRIEALYNDNNLLSLRWDWYTFSGGAHGNYGSKHYVIDLQTGKTVKLADIMSPRNNTDMKAIIEQNIFDQQKKYMADAQNLQDIGFDIDGIVPTENFYLTHKGIGFIYDPYEIASYALGAIEVFIPFSECKELMRKDSPISLVNSL